MKTEKQAIRELRESKSKFEKDGRTKDCFYYNHEECEGEIKNAHSLQKNGVLNIIEDEVEGNMIVFCFQRMKTNAFNQYVGFENIGKGNASTFFGFCDKHDTKIFQPIENHEVDITNDEHKFLLSYRALAKEYHRKVEQVKSFKNNKFWNKPELKKEQESGINGSQAALDELEHHRTIANRILQEKSYGDLRYLTHTLDYTVPLACSSIMTPKFYFDDEIFNFSDNLKDKYEHVYLTVIPTKTKTYILYSCLPEHAKSMKFLDDLEKLNKDDLESVTCSLMVNEIENGFISPRLFKSLEDEEKKRLIEAIEWSDKGGALMHRFYHLGFNFFQDKYKRS
ncbi:MAG: hypothetical protein IPK91_15675 [Saprospiraceae bacterium]|nr:hypothetical protein [Saprospiraceae bacterium]MBK8298684.1 hypothetical protein [Saprospiraceae bacterium]